MTADEVDTGIGPVLTLDETRVRWTFIGFLELGFEENEEKRIACDSVGKGEEEEGSEFAFHVFKGLGFHRKRTVPWLAQSLLPD